MTTRAVVDQRDVIGAAVLDVAVERILAAVGLAAGEQR
jgi:hypothetical protein